MLLRFGFFTLVALVLVSCDQSFDPALEQEKYFSIFGVLDLDADTQWIRVMPIRSSAQSSSGEVDATVELQLLGSGQAIVLRDSLMRYTSPNPELESDVWAHNFWTTETILPDTVYRLTARRSDGATATTLVHTPTVPERLVISSEPLSPNRDFIRIEGVENTALARIGYHVDVCDLDSDVVWQHLSGSAVTSPRGQPEIQLRKASATAIPCPLEPAIFYQDFRQPRPFGDGRLIHWWDVEVVVSGSAWPFSDETSGSTALYDAAGSIENGAGFVGAVARKRVSYDMCYYRVTPASRERCEVVFDDSTAELTGRVLNGACSQDVPLELANVTLSEDGGNRYRFVRADSRGFYRIGGLDPGRTYRLEVTLAGFGDHVETIVLEPAQRLTREIRLASSQCQL